MHSESRSKAARRTAEKAASLGLEETTAAATVDDEDTTSKSSSSPRVATGGEGRLRLKLAVEQRAPIPSILNDSRLSLDGDLISMAGSLKERKGPDQRD